VSGKKCRNHWETAAVVHHQFNPFGLGFQEFNDWKPEILKIGNHIFLSGKPWFRVKMFPSNNPVNSRSDEQT